ncbi:hypothetical protein MAR_010774 [Mya arenaria]|uniref:Uncharacterized protein n=1 Tax=Mya arenaria TaxID=6604 RepID=A0ABY7FS71_MYAAR|nr:hypothetical protein MAR_010774 [Mya arenaria]
MDALFCYHIMLMVLATLAFIFLWTGFSTPGWLVVTFQERQAESEYTVSSINRSLFYDIHCPQELRDCKTCQAGDASDECVTDMAYVAYTYHYTWIEALTADKEEWVAWRVIMIVAVVLATFGFILVLCLVCCIFRTYTYRLVASTGFFLWLIAGIIVWVPVGMVADMQSNVQDTVDSDVPHDATMHIPYSVVLVGIAGFLALVVALMLLWLTGSRSRPLRTYRNR